jgi:hypothetical protein
VRAGLNNGPHRIQPDALAAARRAARGLDRRRALSDPPEGSRGLANDPMFGVMNLDLTDHEAALLLKEVNGIIDGERYFLSAEQAHWYGAEMPVPEWQLCCENLPREGRLRVMGGGSAQRTYASAQPQ